MLKQIRGTLKNVVALFVIALLILAFAAWGVPEMRQLSRNYAIRIGGEGVSALEVQKEFDRFVTNRRLANDGQFDREAAIAAGGAGAMACRPPPSFGPGSSLAVSRR